MALYRNLIPEVRTHLSGAPDVTVLLYLRRAGKQFCQDSRVWDVELGDVEVSPPDGTYLRIAVPSTSLVLPTESALNRISKLWLEECGEDHPISPDAYRYDRPTAMLIIAADAITMDDTLHIHTILEPTKIAKNIPDWMFEVESEGIVAYALFELMSMPGKDWTDERMAGLHKAKYDARVAEGTISKARGGTKRRIRSTPAPFV